MSRINTTPTVRAALWAIRIYLLILLTLIGVKFVRVFSSPKAAINAAPIAAPAQAGEASGGINP